MIRTIAAAIVCLILVALVSRCAQAQDWDRTDIALGTAALAATLVDWGQTRTIAKNPQLWHERNPLLGEHPGLGRVNAYFATAIVGGALVANALPARQRKLFLGGVLVLELAVIGHNKHIGIGVSF